MRCVEAKSVSKRYGRTIALDDVSFSVDEGCIVGLVGRNGAGKTTAIHAILGLTDYSGELRVLGRDPRREREHLMQDVAFVADVAVLPHWLRVRDAFAY